MRRPLVPLTLPAGSVKYGLALAAATSLGACVADYPTADTVLAGHRRSIDHPRPVDRAIAAAAAEAAATCGGPVALNVEGDPADYGSDPSDYECVTVATTPTAAEIALAYQRHGRAPCPEPAICGSPSAPEVTGVECAPAAMGSVRCSFSVIVVVRAMPRVNLPSLAVEAELHRCSAFLERGPAGWQITTMAECPPRTHDGQPG